MSTTSVRRVIAVAVVGLAACVAVMVSAGAASAVPASCNQDEHVTGADSSTGSHASANDSSWYRRWGVAIWTTVHERDGDKACATARAGGKVVIGPDPPVTAAKEAGTFAKMRFVNSSGDVTDSYIRFGYWEAFSADGTPWFNIYVEWAGADGVPHQSLMGTTATLASGFGIGATCVFRIWNDGASGSKWLWRTSVNCGDQTEYGDGGNDVPMPYDKGIPQGLTMRYGGETTGMKDEIDTPRIYSSSGAWDLFQNVACYADTSSNWGWIANPVDFQHQFGWHTVLGSTACP